MLWHIFPWNGPILRAASSHHYRWIGMEMDNWAHFVGWNKTIFDPIKGTRNINSASDQFTKSIQSLWTMLALYSMFNKTNKSESLKTTMKKKTLTARKWEQVGFIGRAFAAVFLSNHFSRVAETCPLFHFHSRSVLVYCPRPNCKCPNRLTAYLWGDHTFPVGRLS